MSRAWGVDLNRRVNGARGKKLNAKHSTQEKILLSLWLISSAAEICEFYSSAHFPFKTNTQKELF
jgi:hypothetical protein